MKMIAHCAYLTGARSTFCIQTPVSMVFDPSIRLQDLSASRQTINGVGYVRLAYSAWDAIASLNATKNIAICSYYSWARGRFDPEIRCCKATRAFGARAAPDNLCSPHRHLKRRELVAPTEHALRWPAHTASVDCAKAGYMPQQPSSRKNTTESAVCA